MPSSREIDKFQAQVLMSQLLDGELSAEDARRLHTYLEQHPEEMDWMEGIDAIRETETTVAKRDEKRAALDAIRRAVDASPSASPKSKLLAFPYRSRVKVSRFGGFRPLLSTAAAIAVVGALTWMTVGPDGSSSEMEPTIVEFVATDIPDASTFIYSDEESGWTVVWVEPSATGADHG